LKITGACWSIVNARSWTFLIVGSLFSIWTFRLDYEFIGGCGRSNFLERLEVNIPKTFVRKVVMGI